MGRGRNTNGWCGQRTLIQLHAMNTTSYHGMLRSDEVLGIRVRDLVFIKDGQGKLTGMRFKIRKSKTSQFDGMRTGVLRSPDLALTAT